MTKPIIAFNDDYTSKNGLSTLYLRLVILKKRVKINLKIQVERKYFDEQKELMTAGKNKKEINLQLEEIKGRASDVLLRYIVLKKELTPTLFLKEFDNPSIVTDFIVYMEKSILNRHGEISDDTIDAQMSVWHKVRDFRKSIVPGIHLQPNFWENANRQMEFWCYKSFWGIAI